MYKLPDCPQLSKSDIEVCTFNFDVFGFPKDFWFCSVSKPALFQFLERYLMYCGVGIQKAQLYEARVREYRQNQLLLNLAKSLFQEQTSLDRLITNIIVEAKKMLKCERCTIFLLDLKMYDQVGTFSNIYISKEMIKNFVF